MSLLIFFPASMLRVLPAMNPVKSKAMYFEWLATGQVLAQIQIHSGFYYELFVEYKRLKKLLLFILNVRYNLVM